MTTLSDDRITGEVIAALAASPKVKETDIEVFVRNRRVILTGAVDTLAEKIAAEEIARQIPGVRAVENDITIVTHGHISDFEVERNVRHQLDQKPELQAIGVHSSDGCVILKGKLPNLAMEQEAIRAAAMARGVREVVSDIEIAPGEPIDDVTLANSVAEALSDAPDLYLQNIEVRAHEGLVEIWGEAPTAHQASLAVEIAAGVPGVQRVESHLVVLESTVPKETKDIKETAKSSEKGRLV